MNRSTTLVAAFETHEQLEQLLGMRMEEGLAPAVGQMDSLLATPSA
ncbi:hypothetical protein [Georgenia halophila]